MAAAPQDETLSEILQRVRAAGRAVSLLQALAQEARQSPAAVAQRASQELRIELDSLPLWSNAVARGDVLPIAECRRIWACPVRSENIEAVFIDLYGNQYALVQESAQVVTSEVEARELGLPRVPVRIEPA